MRAWFGALLMLSAAIGTISWTAADILGTTFTETIGFQPKVILFFWTGFLNTTDGVTESRDSRRGFGVAIDDDGTLVRWCVGSTSDDAAASSNTATIKRNDAVVGVPLFAGGVEALLDIDAMLSTGFRLIVDDVAAATIRISYLALGGPELVADAGEVLVTDVTGTQTITLSGGKTWVPVGVIMAGQGSDGNVGNSAFQHAHLGVGAMVNATQQGVVYGMARDAQGTMDTWSYAAATESIVIIGNGGGSGADITPQMRAEFDAMGAGSFTLDKLAVSAGFPTPIFYLALGGLQMHVAGLSHPTVLDDTVTHTAGFQPVAMLCLGSGQVADTGGLGSPHDRWACGAATGTTARVSQGAWDEDVTAATEVNLIIEYDAILAHPTNAGAIESLLDVDAVLSDGVRYIADDAAPVASFVLSLAFGSQPEAAGIPDVLMAPHVAPMSLR